MNSKPTPTPPAVFDERTRDICFYDYTAEAGNVIVDAGAGIGGEVPTFSRQVGNSGRVLAIEAHPGTFSCLKEMVALNQLSNVTLVHGALTNRAGKVVLSNEPRHISNTIIGTNNGVEVPAMTLDSLAVSESIDQIDLLKMNIEGAEALALSGSSNVLPLTRHVCISCHDFKADQAGNPSMRTLDAVKTLLQDYHFELRFRDDDPRPYLQNYVYGTNRDYVSMRTPESRETLTR